MESVLRRRCKNREMKNIILIYNPKAGDTTFRFSLDRFIEIFSEKDYEVRVFRSRMPGDMATFLEQTDFHDTEAVMVAGGTGTINEVVGAMIRQKIDLPVGIVPAGTENEYARYLGFNGELEDNLKALFAMTEITVDVGRVGDSYFVDSLCVGTLSTISAVSSEMRNAFGKMANYMKGVVSINKLKSMKLQIETGDKRYTGVFTSFIIANEAIRKPGPLSTGKYTLIATRSTKLGREFRYLEKDYPEGQTILRKNVISAVDGIGEVEKGVLRLTGHDFKIRIMDDDTLPNEDALYVLFKADEKLNGKWGWLSSVAYWTDGSICRMNIQKRGIFKHIDEREYDSEIAPVKMCSFVSLLVQSKVIKEVGIPIGEYFIWTDDYEFTGRISRKYPCYMVPGSKVVHAMKTHIRVNFAQDDASRIGRYHYIYRNDVHCYRQYGIKGWAYIILKDLYTTVDVLRHSKEHRLDKIRVIWKGFRTGLSFHPAINKVEAR